MYMMYFRNGKKKRIKLSLIYKDFILACRSFSNTALWKGKTLFVFQSMQTCIVTFSVLGALQGRVDLSCI